MPRPDVCKIADGEEETSPLLYPDKITHFLVISVEKRYLKPLLWLTGFQQSGLLLGNIAGWVNCGQSYC